MTQTPPSSLTGRPASEEATSEEAAAADTAASTATGTPAASPAATASDSAPGAAEAAAPAQRVPDPVKQLKRVRRKARKAEAAVAELEARIAEAEQRPAYPLARPASMKKRHWGLVISFVALVLAPLLAVMIYLWTFAEDQYASTAGFTVRSQESSGANDLLGGLAQFAGTSSASDSDILYEFIQSQEMVAAVDAAVDLQGHYSALWPRDWVFALWPEASLEDLTWYWQRIVGISFDSGSGLIEVQALAFDAATAQAITKAIVAESQTRINALNEQARADAMRYARADLDEALERLKDARQSLTSFRTRTRIVDPEADIQGRMGVMNNLQQQLAEALIQYDLLRGTVTAADPRLTKAQQHIDVIRDRINIERQTFTSNNTDTGGVGEDYPSLIAEFERLTVDREYAEESYRAALTALEVARDDAARQSRYLATYINPTRATEPEYPHRAVLAALAGLFLLLTWSILALIYYSIRDRS
ncbi:putative olysaccharide export protein (plasmid) [Phaeobacter inhibens]|uniref:sugar transporter n=1 Tax=Phaeobacter inhibens TaxID=221822 RepID=UPI000C9985F6|nr:sugar transporter [Phaeobacter inhibens]AUR13857.1 putative olysaccharide export protein [Phaeobacter inhibens]